MKIKHIYSLLIGLLLTGMVFDTYINPPFLQNQSRKGRESISSNPMPEITDAIAMDGQIIVLCRDGTVWQWDYDVGMESAVRISGLEGIVKIANTGAAAYALSEDGQIYAWGKNSGLLINPMEKRDRAYGEPVPLTGLSHITDMGAKNETAFAVDASGNLFVWGLYLYDEEWKDKIPGFPTEWKMKVKDVKKIFAGADGFHYFMKADGMVFSIMESPRFDTNICDFIFPKLTGGKD